MEVDNSTEVKEPSKVVLSFNSPTPMWATYAFRTVIILTTALSAWIAATHIIPDSYKFEAVLGLKFLDTVVWGISRALGVVSDKEVTP